MHYEEPVQEAQCLPHLESNNHLQQVRRFPGQRANVYCYFVCITEYKDSPAALWNRLTKPYIKVGPRGNPSLKFINASFETKT